MALSLDDPETDRLVHELAALTGETVADAVRTALAERLARERRRRDEPGWLADRIAGLRRELAAAPDFDTRSADEIVGYDEYGAWS